MAYHLGKVLEVISFDLKEVISAENTVQASLIMWDENRLIMDVDSKIAGKVKKSDIVLCDYNPVQVGGQAVPRQIIVKIFSKKAGEKIWNEFTEYHSDKKNNKIGNMNFDAGQGMIR
ncbi:MAG: hypothetical protein JW703_04195 [Candidatus Diapherotrites archaeon]|nr:hypothetical protein [Candidatus Diapherotrites archaeon]